MEFGSILFGVLAVLILVSFSFAVTVESVRTHSRDRYAETQTQVEVEVPAPLVVRAPTQLPSDISVSLANLSVALEAVHPKGRPKPAPFKERPVGSRASKVRIFSAP